MLRALGFAVVFYGAMANRWLCRLFLEICLGRIAVASAWLREVLRVCGGVECVLVSKREMVVEQGGGGLLAAGSGGALIAELSIQIDAGAHRVCVLLLPDMLNVGTPCPDSPMLRCQGVRRCCVYGTGGTSSGQPIV